MFVRFVSSINYNLFIFYTSKVIIIFFLSLKYNFFVFFLIFFFFCFFFFDILLIAQQTKDYVQFLFFSYIKNILILCMCAGTFTQICRRE